MSTKKRELLPKINNLVSKLMMMCEDMASLEYMDNNLASKRLKKQFTDIRDAEFKDLGETIFEMRREIIRRPKARDNRQNSIMNLGAHIKVSAPKQEDPTEDKF